MTTDRIVVGLVTDTAIATKVMGWHRNPDNQYDDQWYGVDGNGAEFYVEGGGGDYYHPNEAWEPSTRTDHAMLVAEKMREKGWRIHMEKTILDVWRVAFKIRTYHEYYAMYEWPSLATAVSVAALKAVALAETVPA